MTTETILRRVALAALIATAAHQATNHHRPQPRRIPILEIVAYDHPVPHGALVHNLTQPRACPQDDGTWRYSATGCTDDD